jgi:outer membrane receptor protein involved in Fe transport
VVSKRYAGALLALVAFGTQADTRDIEEVVVTAQKREQTLQEVPVAVSVVTADTIEKAQINDILDLQSVIPSLRVTQLQTSGNTNFIIRGFGNGANNAGIEPSVGVFVDGVYRSRTAAAITDLPNLERIEVLRGPQSTLFGKNASAGVINVVTREADPFSMDDQPTGSVGLSFGNFNQVIVDGDITAKLSDNIGTSFSGYANQRDGYFDNITTGTELNERDRYGFRGEIVFVPTDDLSIRAIADYDVINEACCGVANLVNGPTGAAVQAVGGNLIPEDAFAQEQFLDFDPTNEIDNWGFSLQADYALTDSIELTSITAYREVDRFENADVDFTSAALVSGNTGQTDIETFTQEIRLAGSLGENVDWLVGGFYFDEEVNQTTEITYGTAFRPYADLLAAGGVSATEAALSVPAGTFFAQGQGARKTSSQTDETFSLFAQADFYFGDRTTVTLGLNYTDVQKEASVTALNTDVFSGLDFTAIGFAGAFGTITGGLAPTPENIAANPAAAAGATAVSTTPCDPANPSAPCNALLGLTALQFLPAFQGFPNAIEQGESDDDEITWTARVAYDMTDNINVYGSASTGFKATSWNLSRDSRPSGADLALIQAGGFAVNNIVPGTRFAGPEESTVYELGLKGRWGGNYINVAIFDQTIEGFQSNIFNGTAFTLINAGEQSSVGIEFDSLWAVTDNFDMTFSGIFMNPEYDDFPNSSVGDLTGEQPAGIHEVSISIAGTYYFNIGNDITGFARADYLYEDEVQVVENVPADIASREVGQLNASLSLTYQDRYELLLWGRNLNDDEYLLSAFPSVAQAGSFSGYPNQPRTYGITFRTRFQ